MRQAILADPGQDVRVVFEFVSCLLEGIRINLQESEEMFVKPDGLVVVSSKQSFAMETRLVDQSRQMDVSAEPLIRTARKQFLHRPQN